MCRRPEARSCPADPPRARDALNPNEARRVILKHRLEETGSALEAPPQYQLALVWSRGLDSPVLKKYLTFIRAFRDRNGWTDGAALAND
ncbi:MAG: hypothetical protein JOZ81_29460 [Chloroflexi bacterium]|nr:hypothetical protein [Chloroflexota bacterium]MBV9545397.1 hypothetical protein [Chloroflexota bacterium]